MTGIQIGSTGPKGAGRPVSGLMWKGLETSPSHSKNMSTRYPPGPQRCPMNEHGEDWRSKLEEEAAPGVLPDDLNRAREPGRGREANTPGQIPARGWNDIL